MRYVAAALPRVRERGTPVKSKLRASTAPISANPGDVTWLSGAAEAQFRAGRFAEAIALCKTILTIRPNLPEVYNNIGSAYSQLGQADEAERAYRRALALRPGFIAARRNLSVLLEEAGRLTEARRLADQALRMALATDATLLSVDDRIEMHFALAKVHEDAGRFEQAFQQLAAGNALKRRQMSYDEAATLGAFERARRMFSAEFMDAHSGCGDPSPLPIFILGMPRSGTTLVEQILASHPQVFGAGELPLLAQAVAGMQNLGSNPREPALTSGHLRELSARYLHELAARAPEAARITDKMPHNFRFVGLIHLALPNAAIVHTVRDPVDTCLSNFASLFSNGHPHSYDLAELGRYYQGYAELMAHWRRVLPPGRMLDVRYEDIVADLEGAARRILAHCGLEWDPRCLDFHRTERPVRTNSAAQVRQPLYKNSVQRWRRYQPFLKPLLDELGKAGA